MLDLDLVRGLLRVRCLGQVKVPLPDQARSVPVLNHVRGVSLPGHVRGVPLLGHVRDVSLPDHVRGVSLPGHVRGMSLPDQMRGVSLPDQVRSVSALSDLMVGALPPDLPDAPNPLERGVSLPDNVTYLKGSVPLHDCVKGVSHVDLPMLQRSSQQLKR